MEFLRQAHVATSLRRRAYARDFFNRARWGPSAPRFAERIWVEPSLVSGNPLPKTEGFLKVDSARVVVDWPIVEPPPLTEDIRIKECLARWSEGFSWEDTGRVQRWLESIECGSIPSGCSSERDRIHRVRFDPVRL